MQSNSPNTYRRTSRREVLCASAAATSWLVLSRTSLASLDASKPIRFGLISDVHKDLIHDADARLKTFIETMNEEQVDFVLQLGDFCVPADRNRGFMNIWNSFAGPRHHVIGNHDMDGDGNDRPRGAYAWKQQETVEFWGMQDRYYSFDQGGMHFVILNGSDVKPGGQAGYRRWMGDQQLRWLADDLNKTKLPTIAFIHQSPERANSLENGEALRNVFEEVNRTSKPNKVLACFTGHHHRDYLRKVGSVLYPQINSASYSWLGPGYEHHRYSDQIHQQFPALKYTAPYEESLFALVTVDLQQGAMSLEGRSSKFVAPSPWELGASKEKLEAETLKPEISSWRQPIA